MADEATGNTGFDVGYDEDLADQYQEVFNAAPTVETTRVLEQLFGRLAVKLDKIEGMLDANQRLLLSMDRMGRRHGR
jgi:hypothetical protein